MFQNEAELSAWAKKREEILYNRLLLNRYFSGTVTEIQGSAPQWQVRVTRDGEAQSDGHWHKAAVPGWTPQLGDTVDLVWRDDNVAHVAVPTASSAFMAQGTARLAPPIVFTTSPATASFSAIPQTFTHLWGTWRTRSSSGSPTVLLLRLNNDSNGNYDYEFQQILNTVPAASLNSAQTGVRIGALAASAGPYAGGEFHILDYTRVSTGFRRIVIWHAWRNDANGTGMEHGAATWNNVTDPVTVVGFSTGAATLETGVFNLFGI